MISSMLSLGFIKMLISDDFSDKLVQLFVAIIVIAIVCIAWWSTNIREQPHYRTVFLLERRLRRRFHQSRLTTHIQSSSIVEGPPQIEEVANSVSESETANSTQNPEQNKPPTATTSNSGINNNSTLQGSTEEEELADIVRIMDDDSSVIERRRLILYEELGPGSNIEPTGTSTNISDSEVVHELNTDENMERDGSNHIEPIHDSIMEHNYAERDTVDINITNKENNDKEVKSKSSESNISENSESHIRIKLKYLNDELKLVNGRLEEQLGDFKRRLFHPEFSSNKLVRLIFNGQVLQPDTETLQSCGLFDNCVVHCLIHQQRNSFADTNSSEGGFATTRSGNSGLPQSNSNQGRDWDLGNLLFVLISFIIGSAWYFRYEYSHLYNVTATVALVAITGIFTVFLIGIYFPDPVPQPSPQIEPESN